jgi:hypothetical protein
VRRAVIGLVLVLILVAVAVVLRGQLDQPERESERPASAAVTRVVTSALPWQRVPLPDDLEPGLRPAADLDRQVFPVRGGDGVRRLVTVPSITSAELPTRTVRTTLLGRYVVVQHEISPGVTELATVDLLSGRLRSSAPHRLSPAPMAATGVFVVAAADERCLAVFEPVTLTRRTTHCAPQGWSISLLTAEADGAQWRETGPGERCARWYRLGHAGEAEALQVGDRACRAAVLLRVDEWELTADFPPYDVGAAHPGPLVARAGERQVTLDASVLAPQVCGSHVYWLSRPGQPDQRGELTRWSPGSAVIETLPLDGQLDAASPPLCVNGVLNVLTTPAAPAGTTHFWILTAP